MKPIRLTLIFTLTILLAAFAGAQNKPDNLKTSASRFKLQASGVSYSGFKGSSYLNRENYKKAFDADWILKYKIGDTIYYQGHNLGRLDYSGLVAENPAEETAIVYPLFRMAEAVGWYKPENPPSYPDATRGLYLVGDTLFMGSNGVGVLAFDTIKKTWSRYDSKSEVIPGAHVEVYFADEDYMFVSNGEFPAAGLHVYSMKLDKWRRLEAVPGKSFVEFGTNMGGSIAAQVQVDDRIYAKSEYVPIDWHLALLTKAYRENDDAYLLERSYSKDSKTVFRITKQQLEAAFAAGTKK